MLNPWKDPGDGPRRRRSSRRKRNDDGDRMNRNSKSYQPDDDPYMYFSDRRSSRERIERESEDY